MYGDSDHEEGDEDVDDVEPHQGVLGTREPAAHSHSEIIQKYSSLS